MYRSTISAFVPLYLLFTLLAHLTTTSPLLARGPEDDQEIVYLSDCTQPNTTTSSELDYYFKYTVSGFQPTPPIGVAPLPSLVTWPGSTQFGTFRSGDEQTVQINPGADALGKGSYAGVANNTYGAYLICFRDGGQVVYREGMKECRSQYFCIDSDTKGLFDGCPVSLG